MLLKFNFNFGATYHECNKLRYDKDKKELELWSRGNYFVIEKRQGKYMIKEYDGDSWRTIAINKLKYLEIEIGNRKYTFIDFSEEEIEELVKGEELE